MMINIIYVINIMKIIYHIVKNVKLIYVHYAKDIKIIKEYITFIHNPPKEHT